MRGVFLERTLFRWNGSVLETEIIELSKFFCSLYSGGNIFLENIAYFEYFRRRCIVIFTTLFIIYLFIT